MKIHHISLCFFSALLLMTSCDRFEYHPYSVNIKGDHDINTQMIERLEKAGLQAPFKFAFITDTQGSLDEMKIALDMIGQRDDIDFIIHGGDMTDFGLPKEFLWGRDLLAACGKPYLTVIGNHDCLGNGEATFDYIFGPENFTANIGCVHIVGLNTVALEYDYSKPVPDFDFIEEDIRRVDELNEQTPDSLTHTIVVMHSRPYDEQFNNNVAKPFNHYIMQYPGMGGDNFKRTGYKTKGFCLNGHNHYTDIADIFDNGILYHQCANMGKRTFFIITITDDGYDCEIIDF